MGNQSDKGLQILVATPLFCYWIFGSMNLASGFLVYRRNKDILRNTNSTSIQLLLQTKCSISGVFLFVYCIPYALLLLAVIYEFANIDVWLNESPYGETPEWPFLMRAFMELMLGIICSACILGPKISSMYKRQLSAPPIKDSTPNIQAVSNHKLIAHNPNINCRGSNKAYITASYQTVRESKKTSSHRKQNCSNSISLNQLPNSPGRIKSPQNHLHPQLQLNKQTICNNTNSPLFRYGDETIL